MKTWKASTPLPNKLFHKNFSKKFGGMEKSEYLCTR